jgi:hypothetical protein
MQITINLPHVFSPGSTPVENAPVLQALLEALIAINRDFLKRRPWCPRLYDTSVYYARTYWWEPIPALYLRGFGDCKSLAAALIAEYRNAGIPAKPVFRWSENPQTGSRDFHILVQTANGFEDPSKVKGMGAIEVSRYY